MERVDQDEKVSGRKMMMKINYHHSSVLKSQMDSILYFVVDWVSLEKMKEYKVPAWASELQYEELQSDLDDQVWRDLSDDWQKYRLEKEESPVL